MISPTARAVILLGAGAPLALLIGVTAPGLWMLGLGWTVLCFALIGADVILAMPRSHIEVDPQLPPLLHIGASDHGDFALSFRDNVPPPGLEAELGANEILSVSPASSATGAGFTIKPLRRGMGALDWLWLRWRGPLGLIYRQTRFRLDREIPVTADTRTVANEALRIFSRDAMFGAKAQIERGDGSEFDALRDFTQGMDRRTIDWKQSARHRKLIAKEFQTERNHPIYFVFDTGRLMSQPLDGVPRIDRAVNAALLMAYVSLKMGDRVGLFGFDERPNLVTGAVSGAASFPLLQHHAARLDYSSRETNFTLGLTRLSSALDRRSLIVMFTDFADTTSAGLMIESLGRLLKRHRVIFVAFSDSELQTLIDAEPLEPEHVTRAVVAAELLKERDIVLTRLYRMGADILDVRPDQLNASLLNRYIDLKSRERL